MEKKLKVGVIGVGNIAGAHIDAYRKNPNVELYAFCDINEKENNKRNILKPFFQFTVFESEHIIKKF